MLCSRRLGAEARTVESADDASSSDTPPSRGAPRFHPMPSQGDRGCRPLPCPPSPHRHRGRRVVGITGAAGLGGRRVVGITSLGLLAADVASASRGIAGRGPVALAAASPYQERRRLGSPPSRIAVFPLAAVVCRVLAVSCPPRIVSSGIGTSSVPPRPCGAGGCWGSAVASDGRRGRRVVGIAALAPSGSLLAGKEQAATIVATRLRFKQIRPTK